MRNQILALLYNAGEGFVSVVPVWFVHFSAIVLGFFCFLFDWKKKHVFRNVKVTTNKTGIKLFFAVVSLYENFALNISDYFIIVTKGIDKIKFLTSVDEVKKELLELKEGKGLVVPTAHLGNWELAGILGGLAGFRLHGIGLPQVNEEVERFYKEFRDKYNVVVHPFQGGFIGAFRGVRAGDIATIVSDRDINKDGICVKFFGRNVTFPRGAATLAYRTKVNSAFATLVREGSGYRLYLSDIIDVDFNLTEEEFTKVYVQKFANVLESFIKRFPTQWHHFFDYFKEYSCSSQ
jgi:KDO2-lipid IV(A) lauroyltransferase